MDIRKHTKNRKVVWSVLGSAILIICAATTCALKVRAAVQPITRAPRDIQELSKDFTEHEEAFEQHEVRCEIKHEELKDGMDEQTKVLYEIKGMLPR